jgi:hypothetical protein
MPRQAAQLLDSVIAVCEQEAGRVEVGAGGVAAAAPSACFPSTGYDNVIAGSASKAPQSMMKEVDKHTMLLSLVLVNPRKRCSAEHVSLTSSFLNAQRRWKSNDCTHDSMLLRRLSQMEKVVQVPLKHLRNT